MVITEKEEFSKDYAGEIALECLNLETTLTTGLEDYNNTYRLLGKKSWYSLGLESTDAERDKDSANKRNILLKIIDGIVNFIKMIGRKIVEWYRACKAAILKFFGGEKVDPSQVSTRFETMIAGLKPEEADEIIGKLSQESKGFLSEILNKDYSDEFFPLYGDYKKLAPKASGVRQFCQNYESFTDFKEKADRLKEIAKESGIHENADTVLKQALTGQGHTERIKDIAVLFNEVNFVHADNAAKFEAVLNKIPNDDLLGVLGDANIDNKRREAVKLISDVLKIDGEIVMKINGYMQAVSMLMTYLVKYRFSKVSIIKM